MADRLLLLACGLCLGTAWAAEEVPDDEAMSEAAFIEYLGLWAETDEEWLMHVELQDEDSAGKEPDEEPETENES